MLISREYDYSCEVVDTGRESCEVPALPGPSPSVETGAETQSASSSFTEMNFHTGLTQHG